MITFRPSAMLDKKATIILVEKGQIKNGKIGLKDKSLQSKLKETLQSVPFNGDKGEMFPVSDGGKLFLLVGLGTKKELCYTSLRIYIRNALKSSFLSKIEDVEVVPHEQNDPVIKSIIEAAMIGTYSWLKYKTKARDDKTVPQKNVFIASTKKKSHEDIIKICEGVNLARDLVNDNADTVNSDHLEKEIRNIIKGNKKVSLEILNKKELKAKGLNLHVAVNQGSRFEPKLIIVKYTGAAKGGYTALVGKGITYDTGGLNLKPTGYMETMRYDMGGTAAVIGTLKSVLSLNLKKNIIFACGIAENAIGTAAYKPGDVFKSYSGKTVEIGNTDAEGRLVLADAIAYLVKNYKPARIIDIATLTGACVVALGHDYAGLVSSDDDFARKIVRASNETDDRVWRLPSYPELKNSVKSKIADIRNLGYPKGAAGTMTAAEFLRQFTDGTTWAHLDIAGTAFVDGDSRSYYGHGGTGFGVRLFTNYLMKG